MAHNAATQMTQPQQPDTLFSRGKKQVLIFTSVWVGYLIAYFILRSLLYALYFKAVVTLSDVLSLTVKSHTLLFDLVILACAIIAGNGITRGIRLFLVLPPLYGCYKIYMLIEHYHSGFPQEVVQMLFPIFQILMVLLLLAQIILFFLPAPRIYFSTCATQRRIRRQEKKQQAKTTHDKL